MFCLGKEVTNRELTVRLLIGRLSRVCAKARFFPDRPNECAADQGQIGELRLATAPLSVSVRWYFLAHVSFRHWVILSCNRLRSGDEGGTSLGGIRAIGNQQGRD